MRGFKYLLVTLALMVSGGTWGQYNPTPPDEPGVNFTLTLLSDPVDGGSFNVNVVTTRKEGTTFTLRAYANTGHVFVCWTQGKDTLSTYYQLSFTMPAHDVVLTAHFRYDPSVPAEPSVARLSHRLFLQCSPAEGGSFNYSDGTLVEEGTTVNLRAYANSWYVFQNITQDDSIVSTNSSYRFVMPDHDVSLTANYIYNYDPGVPSEPPQPSGDKAALYAMTASGLPGQTVLLPFYLQNTMTVYGATFDIQLPQGFVPKTDEAVLSERAVSAAIETTATGDNTYRFSLQSSVPLTGDNGELFSLPVIIPDTATQEHTYPVTLSQGFVVKADGTTLTASLRNGSVYVERKLPDLHVSALDCTQPIASSPLTVSWTVVNDGIGTTADDVWFDYVWLVPDVWQGTAQNGAVLLTTVQRPSALDVGETYTSSATITLNDRVYGNYYLIVTADMRTVSNIEWNTVGGLVVNPYQPADGIYGYMYATTDAAYNRVKEMDETPYRSDNFFYKKIAITSSFIPDDEWLILKQAWQAMGSGEGWSHQWDFNTDVPSVLRLPGVTTTEGHVTSIRLTGNNISGSFPFALLALPYLEELSLNDNGLTGDIGEGFAAFAQSATVADTKLTRLDISNNRLKGNIAPLANACAGLLTLNAAHNSLDAVTPMISPTVTSLDLSGQTITAVADLTLSKLSAGGLKDHVPNIFTYNHQQQDYAKTVALQLADADGQWSAVLTDADGSLQWQQVSARNDWHGNSGDTLCVDMLDDSRKPCGKTFRAKLTFDDGDANFDGTVDLIDLQTTINYAFQDYADRPFNFTAANLRQDDIVNVQDVVKLVSLLMSIDDDGSSPAARPAAPPLHAQGTGGSDADAHLYIEDGCLMLHTEVPVASLDITLADTEGVVLAGSLANSGYTVSMQSGNGSVRFIAYSLAGLTLPQGTSVLASIATASAQVRRAMLADVHARAVTTEIIGMTTAVTGVDGGSGSSDRLAVYDLQSRRVTGQLRKGVYIQNGRKVIHP